MPKLALRFFVEEPSDAAAELVADRLRGILASRLPAVAIKRVQQYWKIPEYREVSLESPLGDNATSILGELISMLGGGTAWTIHHKREAIWTAAPSISLIERAVRWVHIELFEVE